MKTAKLLYWLPRIICIAAILFVSMFALDAFRPGATVWQQIGDFIMHLIPSFILAVILAIAWKRELAGGILFTAIGVIMTPFIFNLNHNQNQFSIGESINVVLMISFPFVVVGVLFILSYYQSRKTI
jgi:Na+/phosphate symporter